jgi:uncharacterized membrane protein YsdA (DUF1294 family)
LPVYLIVAIYALLNLVALIAFWGDKRAAVRKEGRTPERTLLVLALFGPFGAVAGMRVFHHKTRKAKFLLVPAFLVLHLGIITYLMLGPAINSWL